MNTNTKWVIPVLVGAVALIAGLLIWNMIGFSVRNQEARLRAQIAAKQRENTTVFDTTWKIISQQAQIADRYKEQFREVYGQIMEARYSGNEQQLLMKFIQESNPQFDASLMKQLMTSVEAQRVTFQQHQAVLLDLKREHDTLRTTYPGTWFVGNVPEIPVQIVTSARTDETFQTGQENDVDVFGK